MFVLLCIYAAVGQVVIPSDVTIDCNGDTAPSTTGWATKDGVNQVYAESADENTCRLQITRYWRDAVDDSELGTQTITVNYALRPVITRPPTSVVAVCDGTWNSYDAFIASESGGAVVEEPCGTTLSVFKSHSEHPDSQQCQWSSTVIYTFVNLCSEAVSATATFTSIDNTPPLIVTLPTPGHSECNSDITNAFNQWLSAAAGASAESVCTGTDGIVFTHNFQGSVTCGQTYSVNFRPINNCGFQGSTVSAEFTIADFPPPITQSDARLITLPFDNIVNGDLSLDYELPAEWEGIGVVDALWYRVARASEDRVIIASTCTTTVDSFIAILVAPSYSYDGPNDGSLTFAAANDDRSEDSEDDCNILSSYVEYTVPANSDFYIVVAAYDQGGDIDLSIYEAAATCEELIINAQSEIISSVNSEIGASTSLLLDMNNNLRNDVSQLNSDTNNVINNLNTALLDQFSQLQINVADTKTDLSSVIVTSEYNLSVQVEELAGSVYNIAYGLQAVANMIGSTDDALNGLANNLNDYPATLAGVAASVDDVANTQLPEVNNAVNWLAANTETNFNVLGSLVNSRFDVTDGSVAQVSSQTNNVLTNVDAVNTVVTQIQSYLETVNFERYLISSIADISTIPWQYRTPATYMGKMDDMLSFVIRTYNTKLTTCEGSTATGCVWFRSNTASSYNTLVSTYNTHVSNQKFKKAFEVLQSFYLKMFPTSLFV